MTDWTWSHTGWCTQELDLGSRRTAQINCCIQIPTTRKITMYLIQPWSLCVRAGPLSSWCFCGGQHDQMYMGNITASSLRAAEVTECLIRGWMTEQVRPLPWPRFATSPGPVDALRRTCSSNGPWKDFLYAGAIKLMTFQSYQNQLCNTLGILFPMWRSVRCHEMTFAPIPRCWCSLKARSGPLSTCRTQEKNKLKHLSYPLSFIPQLPHPNQRPT